jgi:lipopolysaccharide/colanic/teichoic acid biosynthesis glycosyltransferase
MRKFRTMFDSNDQRVHQDLAEAWFRGDPAAWGYRRSADRRVTRVGRLLRATDVDELPQLFNVIRGDMSLVGPRPAIPYELQYYKPGHFGRLRVKPGITGPWQVSGRDRRSAQEMIAMDIDYAARRSAWVDFKILARTVPVVLADIAAALR